jgi:hypothetical protein
MVGTASIIAQHADYVGKQKSVVECLEDIEYRWNQVMLTQEQRFRLYAVLISGTALRLDRILATAV